MPAKTVNVKSSSGTSRNVRNVALAASVPERVPTRVPATFRTTMFKTMGIKNLTKLIADNTSGA